jgi:1,4-dihydroxy-6-naphthoate synthase
LPPELARKVAAVLADSVRWGLEHRQEALTSALAFARGLDRQQADRFVGMYVNQFTLDYGPQGQEAIHRFLRKAYQRRLIPALPPVEFVFPEDL